MRHILAATFMFAFGPVLVRMGLQEGLQANHLVVLRLAVAFPAFLAAVALSGSLGKARITMREIPYIFLISVVGMGGAMLCFFHSIYYLGASVASLIGAITPVVTALMAYVAFSRPVTRRQTVSMSVSFLGVFFLVIPITGLMGLGKVVGSSVVGLGYSLLATVCASATALGFEKYVERKTPLVAAFHVTGFMFVFIGAAYGLPNVHFTTRIWEITLALGIFTWFIPFMLFFYGIREIGASGTVLVQNMGPLLTTIAAGLIFGEKLFPAQMVGMILVLSSVFVLALERKALKEDVFTLPEG